MLKTEVLGDLGRSSVSRELLLKESEKGGKQESAGGFSTKFGQGGRRKRL